MTSRNSPLVVDDVHKNVTRTNNWTNGSQRNKFFPPEIYEHSWKKRADKSPVVVTHSGRGFGPLSRYYAQIPGINSDQVCVVFVLRSWLRSDSICSFVDNNVHATATRNILGMFFECMGLETVGPLPSQQKVDEHTGPIDLIGAEDGVLTRQVFLETVRNVTGSVVGYRYFFVNNESAATWGDMFFSGVSRNRNRKKLNRMPRDWAAAVRANPHWGIQTLKELSKTMAMAVTDIQAEISDIMNSLASSIVLMPMARCLANPVKVFTLERALCPRFSTESRMTAGLHICPEQANPDSYRTLGSYYNFPDPSAVIRLPSMYHSLDALSRVLPPNLRLDPMEQMVQELMSTDTLSLTMDAVFDRIQYLNSGRAPPTAPPRPEDEGVRINPETFLPRHAIVDGSQDYYQRLAILGLEKENRDPFYQLIDARNQPDMTKETYQGHIDNYQLSSLDKFERVVRPENTKLTKAERGAVKFLFDHIDTCKAKNVPIFNSHVKFVPFTEKTDHSLEYGALFFTELFRLFENLGATRGHKDLVLMLCAAYQSCSYDMSQDNLIMVHFGGAGVGKSWALDLFADLLLIFDTVAKYSHMTDMVGQTGGDSAGLITIVHEFSKRQMGIDERNPNSTGETHHKTQNDPRRCILAFYRDPDTGERMTLSTKAFKRTTTLAATNDRKGAIPKPMLSRMIPCDNMPETRFSASAHENCESRNPQTERKEQQIAYRFQLMQSLFYFTRWLVDSKTVFLPHGINHLGAQAVMEQFKYNMEKQNIDIHSNSHIRSLNRVYIVAEALCIMEAVAKTQQELCCEMEFDLALFAKHVTNHLFISEMQMRWALQLCIHEFLDPIEYPIMQAISSLTNYANNKQEGKNGRTIQIVAEPEEEPLLRQRVEQRINSVQQESERVTDPSNNVSAELRVPPVKYARTREGAIDYNNIAVELQWNKFQSMIRDEVKYMSGKELTNEQVHAVLSKMLDSTHLCRNRIDHRKQDQTTPVRRAILRRGGYNNSILINADYLDHSETKPIQQVNDAIADLQYPGQVWRSTVMCQPVTGCPWILRRKEAEPSDSGFQMQTKNSKMPINPDYSDRSSFCQKLLMFDRRIFVYNGSIDDTVQLHHMVSMGRSLQTAEDWAPFRLMSHSKRKVDARAEQICRQIGPNQDNITGALVQARLEAQTTGITIKPTWPIQEIVDDFTCQALNLMTRSREVPPAIKDKVRNMFTSAMQECGHADAHMYMGDDPFQVAKDKYKEAVNQTGQRFLESHKRGREEDDTPFMDAIMGGATKFFKPLNMVPIPTITQPEPAPMQIQDAQPEYVGDLLSFTEAYL